MTPSPRPEPVTLWRCTDGTYRPKWHATGNAVLRETSYRAIHSAEFDAILARLARLEMALDKALAALDEKEPTDE